MPCRLQTDTDFAHGWRRRLVDEMLVSFTHDVEIDWMLPGVPPTGKYVEVPTVAIVNFRGDKLYHEHIYWDQASVLVQIGLLDPAGLPVAGSETAKKLVDETRPSNALNDALGGECAGRRVLEPCPLLRVNDATRALAACS
jgi:carboxymethylenebutenolidase